MDPVRIDMVWRRNAPEAATYTFFDNEAGPFDLTNFGFAMQVRAYPGAGGGALVTLGMAAAGTPGFFRDDPANGVFTLTPPTAATLAALPLPSDLTSGELDSLAYDILLIHPDGAPEPFMEGRILLISGVTRL